jgi:hypothetical protein
MRFLQNALLVLGSTVFGTVLGFVALAALVASIQAPRGEPWQRGYGQFLGGAFCGAPLGTLAGFVVSLGWIRTRPASRVWGPFLWLGIVSGLVAGVVYCASWMNHGGPGWWVAALVVPACGTVGGILASSALALVAPAKQGR